MPVIVIDERKTGPVDMSTCPHGIVIRVTDEMMEYASKDLYNGEYEGLMSPDTCEEVCFDAFIKILEKSDLPHTVVRTRK